MFRENEGLLFFILKKYISLFSHFTFFSKCYRGLYWSKLVFIPGHATDQEQWDLEHHST